MSKFKIPNFGAVIRDYEKKVHDRSDVINEQNLPAIREMLNLPVSADATHAGGTAVAVQTPAYKKWLAQWQEKNPFIGKHAEIAPEYEEESEETQAPVEMSDENVEKIGHWKVDEDGIERYHINDDFEPYMPKEFDPKLDGDAAKLSDLYLMQNVVSERIGCEYDIILDDVEKALAEAHIDDPEFEMPENLDEMVSKAIEVEETRLRITDQSAKNREKPENP